MDAGTVSIDRRGSVAGTSKTGVPLDPVRDLPKFHVLRRPSSLSRLLTWVRIPPSRDPPASSGPSPEVEARLDLPDEKALVIVDRSEGLLAGTAAEEESRAPSPRPWIVVADPEGEIDWARGK